MASRRPLAVPTALPPASLLAALHHRGRYTDCFTTPIALAVSQAQFVEAFYTTRLFKAERLVLWLAGRGSNDQQAAELAAGRRDRFAAWRVTERRERELLLADDTGRTSSWLMAEPEALQGAAGTRLYFGSAVHPRARGNDGQPSLGFVFHALLGLHKLYSRQLLQAAARNLLRRGPQRAGGEAG